MKRPMKFLPVVLAAAVILAALPAVRSDDDDNERVARVTGHGTAAFDEGEELFGYETGFAVKARVRENGRARGEFYCDLTDHPDIPPMAILGDVDAGKVYPDGSVKLTGTAIVIDLETGALLEDEFPFEVILWAGRRGVGRFIYYDHVTGAAGDAETVTSGRIRIDLDDD